MTTIKCNKPDAKDENMLDRWINFHNIRISEYDRIEAKIDDLLKESSCVYLFEPNKCNTKEKLWITRLVLTDDKDVTTIIYTERPVYIMEDGKTTDRIN